MKKSRIIASLLTAAAVGISLVGCSFSSDGNDGTSAKSGTLQEVLERGHLIVGTGSTNVPWHFKNDAGELEGMDIEIGRIIANGLFGDPDAVEFVEQAPAARIPNLLTNKVDLSIQFITINPERLQQIALSVPYYTEGVGLILSTNGKYKNIDDLNAAVADGEDVKVAILQNAFGADIVQELLPGSKDDQYQEPGVLYQAIDSGQADAAAVDLSSIRWLASKSPEKYVDSGRVGYPANYGVGMRPNDQEWINFVNGVLTDAMSGASYAAYNAAYKKYFGETLPSPSVGKPSMFRSSD